MDQIRICAGYIKPKVAVNVFKALILGMIISAVFVGIGMAMREADGITASFSVAWFLLWLTIVMLICMPYILYDFFWNKSFTFGISEDKIYVKGGILRTVDRVTDIKRVTDATIYQDFWGKCFHYSSIGFQTAGSYITEVVFFGISLEDANRIRDFVHSKLGKNS